MSRTENTSQARCEHQALARNSLGEKTAAADGCKTPTVLPSLSPSREASIHTRTGSTATSTALLPNLSSKIPDVKLVGQSKLKAC